MATETKTVHLLRSGDAPLWLEDCEVIAEVDGQGVSGEEHTRWHNVKIYRLVSLEAAEAVAAGSEWDPVDDTYALAIEYHSTWKGEVSHFYADCMPLEDVIKLLKVYDPTACVKGYPVHPTYVKRQQALLQDVKLRYEACVTEALNREVFAERKGGEP